MGFVGGGFVDECPEEDGGEWDADCVYEEPY